MGDCGLQELKCGDSQDQFCWRDEIYSVVFERYHISYFLLQKYITFQHLHRSSGKADCKPALRGSRRIAQCLPSTFDPICSSVQLEPFDKAHPLHGILGMS